MNLCSIVPVQHYKWMYNEAPMVMCLTHLVENYPKYRNFAAKHHNVYKILDNSLIEMGSAFSIERVYNAAVRIGADEIILEDCYPDGPKTIEAVERSLKWLRENDHIGEFKLNAVCHGRNFEEFEQTFNYLDNIPEIDVISLPKILCEWCFNRGNLYPIFKDTHKKIHFLGAWDGFQELYLMPKEVWDKVRSCDTCLPSLYAIQYKHVWQTRKGVTINLEQRYRDLTKKNYQRVLQEFEDEVVEHQVLNCTHL